MINKSIAKTVILNRNIYKHRLFTVLLLSSSLEFVFFFFYFAQKYEWLVAVVSNVKSTLSLINAKKSEKIATSCMFVWKLRCKTIITKFEMPTMNFRFACCFIFQIEYINSNSYSLEKYNWTNELRKNGIWFLLLSTSHPRDDEERKTCDIENDEHL